jgi:hypothetical protein
MEDMQPGQVISPRTSSEPPIPPDGSPAPERPAEQPEPAPTPQPAAEPAVQVAQNEVVDSSFSPVTPETPFAASDADGWQSYQESFGADVTPLPDDFTWTASEFIAHEKSAAWYGALAAVGIVIALLAYLLTKDKISTAVIVFTVVAFGLFAARKPRTQQYGLGRDGVIVGQKGYGFEEFKNFSVTEDGTVASIVLMPMKRFMPPLTIYVLPDMEDRVMDYLSAFLPFEQHKSDAVDSLLRRIHF